MRAPNRFASLLFAISLASVLGCDSTVKEAATGKDLDDTLITAKVRAHILDEPSLKSAQINVETFKGKVQLRGLVSSQTNINTAVQIAHNVAGVVSVQNHMWLE
jgi:osmotically-inducible protein OsmY